MGVRQAGVLDVGCHSALLTVVRWRSGGSLEPVFSHKVRLSLHETLDRKGRLGKAGVESVQRAVAEAVAANPQLRRSEFFPFATSVIRDAPNRDEVIARVARATGTRLRVMTGEEEARLAYVAARQWTGSVPGPLLVLDIGGGTVEIASGTGDQPRVVRSLPLGARRITRDWLPGGTGSSKRRLAEVRQHLRQSLSAGPGVPQAVPGGRVLACSKTFEQLARLMRRPWPQDTATARTAHPPPAAGLDRPARRRPPAPRRRAAGHLPAPRRAVPGRSPDRREPHDGLRGRGRRDLPLVHP